MPPRDKGIRCRYYNDLGWPRYNPTRAGDSNPLGCKFGHNCRFAHPDEEEWRTAKLAHDIPLHFYPDGIRPDTPEPERRRRVSTQLDPLVKQEHTSPKLPSARSNSISTGSRQMSVASSRDSGGRRPRSPTPGGLSTDPFDKQKKGSNGTVDRLRDRDQYFEQWKRREQAMRGSYRDDYKQQARDRRNSRGEYDSPRRDSGYTRNRDRFSEDYGRARSPPPYSAARSNFDGRRSRERASPRGLREAEDDSSRGGKKRSRSPPLIPPHTPSHSTAPTLDFAQHSASTHPKTNNTKKEEENAMAMAVDEPSHSAQDNSMAQQPLPPPSLPLFLDAPEREDTPLKVQLSAAERGKVWEERLELLTTAISARRAARDFERDVDYYKSLQNTSRYNINEQKSKIDSALAKSESQAAAAALRAKEAQDRLNELDFWPVRRKLLSNADSKLLPPIGAGGSAERDFEEDFQKIKKNVTNLHDEVSRLDQQLREVTTFVNSRTRTFPTSTSNNSASTNENEMDWEPSHGTKRRRTGSDSPAGVVVDRQEVFNTTNVERVMQRIEALEAQCEELSNLYVQEEHAATEEIAAQVEIAIEAARERGELSSSQSRSELDSGGDTSGRKEEKEARLATLEGHYEQLNKEVDELTSTVTSYLELAGELRIALESQKDERTRIDQERKEIRAQMAESRTRMDELHATLQKQIEETASLRTALEKAQVPPPPLVPTPDELSMLLLPRLLNSIRPEIMNQLRNVREDLAATVRAEAPAYNHVRGHIEKLLRLPEVTPFMEQWAGTNGIRNDTNSPSVNSVVVNGRSQDVSTPIRQSYGLPPKTNLL